MKLETSSFPKTCFSDFEQVSWQMWIFEIG